jgi:glycosyltransferase involved in cell wall biosynthesis
MKIGIVSNLYPPNINGGAEIVAHELANNLSKAGHEVFVITLSKHDDLISEERVRIYKIAYRNGNFVNADNAYSKVRRFLMRIIDLQNPLIYFAFKKILLKEKPDLIHCHNIEGISTSIWKCAHKLRIPIVQHFHDYFFICRHGNLLLHEKFCMKPKKLCSMRTLFFKKMINNYVDWIISPSDSCYQKNIHFLSDTRKTIPYKIISNGTSLTAEPLVNRDFLYDLTLNVCFIGALIGHKGIQVLIDCIKEINKRNINVKFSIAGKGQLQSSIITLSQEFTNIEYLGFINKDEKIKLLQKSHLMIFTSIWPENNPIVLLEAYAMGLPVIASQAGGVSEIIPENWCFTLGNSKQLSDKLTQVFYNRDLLSNESKRIIQKRADFTVERQIIQTLNVYKDCIKKRSDIEY